MKRLMAIALAVALLLVMAVAAPVAAKSVVIHVYPGGSIQPAVDTPGVTTVLVHAGVYNQSVVFGPENSGITLKGEAGAILDGTSLGGVNAITLSANGVTIQGFEIRNYGGQGIRGWGSNSDPLSGITLRHLNIHDVGSADPDGHGHAIDLRHGADIIIQNVRVAVGPGAVWWAEAIRLESIDGVQVINVDIDGGWIGVNFARESEDVAGPPTNGVVKGSIFTGNGLFGVFIANSTDATIVGNEITGAELFGIYAGSYSGVTGITVKGNKVSDTGSYHGIVLNMVNSSSVLGNEVSGSGMDGIALYGGASNNEVKENKVSSSGRYGISLRGGASDNLVKENEVSGSGTFDLHWDGSGTNNVWQDNVYGTSNLP